MNDSNNTLNNFNQYLNAAEQGDAEAQNFLAKCYSTGDGVDKDYKLGAYWFAKSAEQGNAYGQNGLGICYYNGQGVVKDNEMAVYWLSLSANQGFAKAQYNLGNCYYKGEGIVKDCEKASVDELKMQNSYFINSLYRDTDETGSA